MGVAEDFRTFCNNIAVKKRESISDRYALITRRFNIEFWGSESNVYHSMYAGSYGRGTATGLTSDVDIFWLPYKYYSSYNSYIGNGQSALLQLVRTALQKTYPTTEIGGDGQVVVVHFTDSITFEILPAFENKDGTSFTYPDSNGGGSWKTTNPRPEIAAINAMDKACNDNLRNLCQMARAWKSEWDVPIGGLLIDTLAYYFIRDYQHRLKSFLYYDYMSRDFLRYLADQDENQQYWRSPGANQYVWRKGNFEYKALRAWKIADAACGYQSASYGATARKKWREVYGTSFPI